MDEIGIHRVPPRNLRNRYAWHRRLRANRTLLIIRPEPLLLTQDVHYQQCTLSDHIKTRQSGQTRRLGVLDHGEVVELKRFLTSRAQNLPRLVSQVLNRNPPQTSWWAHRKCRPIAYIHPPRVMPRRGPRKRRLQHGAAIWTAKRASFNLLEFVTLLVAMLDYSINPLIEPDPAALIGSFHSS